MKVALIGENVDQCTFIRIEVRVLVEMRVCLNRECKGASNRPRSLEPVLSALDLTASGWF